jgi:tRNA A37 threonylcarbamoyladenosine synthetase subunit TsaC/SUA5/YrdC
MAEWRFPPRQSLPQALELVEVEGQAREAVEALAKSFWPGPLTLIAR